MKENRFHPFKCRVITSVPYSSDFRRYLNESSWGDRRHRWTNLHVCSVFHGSLFESRTPVFFLYREREESPYPSPYGLSTLVTMIFGRKLSISTGVCSRWFKSPRDSKEAKWYRSRLLRADLQAQHPASEEEQVNDSRCPFLSLTCVTDRKGGDSTPKPSLIAWFVLLGHARLCRTWGDK